MAEYQRTRPPPLDYNPKHFLPALRWTIGSDRGAKAAFAREAAPIIGLQDVSLQAALGREIATEHHTALAGIFGKSPKQLINDYLATHPELNRIASPSRDEDLQR
jgi:hypothetical protein